MGAAGWTSRAEPGTSALEASANRKPSVVMVIGLSNGHCRQDPSRGFMVFWVRRHLHFEGKFMGGPRGIVLGKEGAAMRRMLTAGIVLAPLPLGSFIVAPGVAGASGGSVDATSAEISCSAVQGTVTFNPPLMNLNNKVKVTFAETVSSCTPTGVTATVSKGVVTATLTTDISCTNISDSSSFGTKTKGSIVWTSSPRLSSGNTIFQVAPLHWTTDGSKMLNTLGWSFGTDPLPSGSFQGQPRRV